jgi:molecular chaperone HtpG
LLHGVIDSPDIPLNVSRSYLQADSNVKKISSHITKKVADRLEEIFKTDRPQFESKWDNLKLFIEYGMLTDEKFYERAKSFMLVKNIEGKYFTLDEYETLVKPNQTDKNDTKVYLYATDKDAQYTYIEGAKAKGYDVLLLDGQLDMHIIGALEQKLEKTRFARVDADVIGRLIQKDDQPASSLAQADRDNMIQVFNAVTPDKGYYIIEFEDLGADAKPLMITQNEFMRRMKDTAAMSGMNYYADMPDSFNLVVNTAHPLITKVLDAEKDALGSALSDIDAQIEPLDKQKADLETQKKDKKEEEIPQQLKDQIADVEKQINTLRDQKDAKLKEFGKSTPLVKQLVDLALLANNMLKGEDLNVFVNRSVELLQSK